MDYEKDACEVLEISSGKLPEAFKDDIRAGATDILFENLAARKKFRLIREDYIDEIMCQELTKDPVLLGNFEANFLASILEWPLVGIELLKRENLHSALGQSIINYDRVNEVQEEYVKVYGYNEYFTGKEQGLPKIDILTETFFVFELT